MARSFRRGLLRLMVELEDIRLYDATPDEAATLSDLAQRSKSHWGYSKEFMQSCTDELTYHADQLVDENCRYVVADVNAEIIGFYALAKMSAHQFELEALFVEPAYIGQGIGRNLLCHALDAVREKCGTSVLIQGDPNAETFYLAAGAKRVGTRESGSIAGRFLPLFEIRV